MTQRWRKKLRGIDQVGPSEDVYERAKRGPSLPEPQSPMQRTSTRVVTAIAAFTVFALAISLFVIPALRLGGTDRFASAGSQIQPLWPWNSIDAVQAWRDDPQSIGSTSVDHFSSPDGVATGFGRDVLGWGEVWAREDGTPQAVPCFTSGAIAYPDMSSAPPAGDELCHATFPSGSMPPTMVPYASTTAPPEFRTFRLSPCQIAMTPSCDSLSGVIPQITVVVFQPLGAEGPWAVLEAESDYMSISLDPGTQLPNGSTAYASGLIFDGTHAVLGYHASADGCGEHSDVTGFERVPSDTGADQAGALSQTLATYSRGQLQFALPPQSASCARQPGYVFVAITSQALDAEDPLRGVPGSAGLIGFMAVPVSFVFLTEEASSSPPLSPAASEGGWTTYTDDTTKWTIDVPTSWSVRTIDGSDATSTYEGGAFGSASLDQYPGGPTTIGAPPGEVSLILYHGTCTGCPGPGPSATSDDTRFPLDIANMDPVDGGYLLTFQADGILFSLSIRVGGDAPTPDQMSILERMVGSIRFAPWEVYTSRDGWTALRPTTDDEPVEQRAKISWQICKEHGCYVLVYGDYGPGGEGPYVLGPIPPCGEGENMTADPASLYRIVLECPDGTTQAWGAPGEPSADNTPPYDHALNVYPTIHAWDGTLLTNLGSSA